MTGPKILLVVGGGIAAYKACELVRLIRKGGGQVSCVLTEGGSQFITAMTLAALSENRVHTSLWDLTDEVEMGHIQLSRAADLVVVCPATADLLARMAHGIADDMATTLLLATDKPVLAVPAMNVRMWQHPATQDNVGSLIARGVQVLDPDHGPMACGEYGPGRLPEPGAVWNAICGLLGLDQTWSPAGAQPGGDQAEPAGDARGLAGLSVRLIARAPTYHAAPYHLSSGDDGAAVAMPGAAALDNPLAGQPDFADDDAPPIDPAGPLNGRHVLITAGPTHEPIDPVRYIANRSSGKQGYALAAAAARLGARVTLVSGPVQLATPRGAQRIDVQTAVEMADAVRQALPADVAVMVAAVADWRVSDVQANKLKKKRGATPPALRLTENPDVLAMVASAKERPRLVIGFAAETERVIAHAKNKRRRKGADWIIANDVSGGIGDSVMGGDLNTVHIVTAQGVETLPQMAKAQVAQAIVERIADALEPLAVQR